MKRFFKFNIILLAMLSLLSACGGGGEGDSTNTSRTVTGGESSTATTLSGTVADGYLTDALVFLDRNQNRVYDNGEPMAQSTAGGVYTLEVNPGEGDLYPVVVQVFAGQTIDEDTGVPVANSYLLETVPGHWEFVSPLTTLVKLECDKNPSFSVQQAEIEVRSQLGVADSVSLFTDYIAPGTVDMDLVAEYGRAHRAAQIVANLMGSVRASLSENLGGQIAETEQLLAAFIVSDQILWQAQQIELALDNERNQGEVMDVASLTTTILGNIDVADLDATLLVRYLERLEQNFEIWDMQSPQLQSQTPPTGDSAPVNTIISVSFDESLDETLLTSGIVELSGPNGLVSGSLDYDAEQTRLTFTPSQLLIPFSNYQVTVKDVLADAFGNPLDEDIIWAFTTIFDQLPPALPDF
ncbi:MAG: Ig-like domain-containing protein [Thermodesulfobacteriota bacterium]|nr:Ig-like domain-containing protein [Thermodesulfobacteriota bacterium]